MNTETVVEIPKWNLDLKHEVSVKTSAVIYIILVHISFILQTVECKNWLVTIIEPIPSGMLIVCIYLYFAICTIEACLASTGMTTRGIDSAVVVVSLRVLDNTWKWIVASLTTATVHVYVVLNWYSSHAVHANSLIFAMINACFILSLFLFETVKHSIIADGTHIGEHLDGENC